MADLTRNQENTPWPIPKFYFRVTIKNTVMNFSEVSGLDTETEIIEYRAGNSPEFLSVEMPGIHKIRNVTMKKGIFFKDNQFWNWLSKIKMNTIERLPIKIELLDETGQVTMIWNLHNAWPTKITATDLKSDSNEAAIETLEISYESMEIKNP